MKSEVEFDIKAVQEECLKIMDAFDGVCRKHGLRYYGVWHDARSREA